MQWTKFKLIIASISQVLDTLGCYPLPSRLYKPYLRSQTPHCPRVLLSYLGHIVGVAIYCYL